MARPGRLELPTLCLEAVRTTLPNLARGVANRTESAGWYKFPQTTFSFICRALFHNCCYFPQLALHFRDSRYYQPNAVEDVRLLASVTPDRRSPTLPINQHRMQSRQESPKSGSGSV